MSVSTLSRRIAAAVVAAVVVALLPLAPASAAGDTITLAGISAGEYLPSGTPRAISAAATTTDTAISADLYIDGAVVPTDTQVCDPPPAAPGDPCSVVFAYDTAVLGDGTHTAEVRLTTDVGTDTATDAVTFFVGDAPVASITAPASGTYSGSIEVTVRGVTDPQGTDFPASFTLRADGTTIGTALACTADAKDCSQTFTWDISDFLVVAPGAKTLTAEVTTQDGTVVTSADRSITVAKTPTVSISVPTQNSTVLPDFVTGAVPVTVTAATDATLESVQKSVSLFVDGALTATTTGSCTSVGSCDALLTWNAGSLTPGSTHTFFARVIAGGVTRDSAIRSVRIASLPTATITSPTNGSKVLPSSADVVTVTATGVSDNQIGSRQKSFELFIDGAVTPTDTAICTSTGTCSSGSALTWDASGAAGGTTHTAVVKVTVAGRVATSSTVSFTLADSPAVTVVAAPGGSIKGASAITVTAQTDAVTVEDPQSVVLTATNSIDTLVFDPVSCDSTPVDGACSFTIPWDVSSLTGSYTLTAELTTTNGRTRTSAGVVFGIDNPAPTVTLTAPTATVLKGRVTVSMTAKIEAPLTGHITTIALFAGGKQLGATKTCAVAATCTISGLWDTTLLADGTAGILAVTTTSNTSSQTFNSPTTTVTLRNPSPSITWISPSNGAVVSGSAVTIKVGFSTDATQSDVPKSAAIYRNGSSTPFDTYFCAATSHSCIATFTWNASRAAGLSTFVVKVRTTKDRVRFSSSTSPRKLYASSGARITFVSSTTVDNGARVTVSGRMVAVRTGLGVPNAKVALVRNPALGSTVTTTVRTSSTGRFTLTYTATSNTTITARSVSLRTPSGAIWMPATTGIARQQVRAPMTCGVLSTVSVGQKGRGSCSVPGLPSGTPLILRYLFGGTWTTLARGTSTTTTIPFFYQFPAKGFYQLRVILSGNAAYAGTNSPLLPVTVR